MTGHQIFLRKTDLWIWKFNQSQYFGNIFYKTIVKKLNGICNFLRELQKKISWNDKIQKVTILST